MNEEDYAKLCEATHKELLDTFSLCPFILINTRICFPNTGTRKGSPHGEGVSQ